MNIIEKITLAFHEFLKSTFNVDNQSLKNVNFDINIDETKQAFGDINSNSAMILAKQLKKNPREIAETIKNNFTHQDLKKIEIAGPGFLNFFLKHETYQTIANEIFKKKDIFFKPSTIEKKIFNIEFVSANPTGPLHIGHGRGGIIGDVLGNILTFVGHDVTKEFYINDAGAQITKLGNSFKIRCQQQAGLDVQLPEQAYHGDYLVTLAKETIEKKGKNILEKPDSFFQDYAKEKMLAIIQKTLTAYGIHFDEWFSEKSLHSGAVNKALDFLDKHGYLYEKENALWFKSTNFGDDKDRVVKKSSGEFTYVASDIAYLVDKYNRGFTNLIMTLGHDHHSYAVRIEGLRQALEIKASLDIILYQLVKMKESGQLMKMSKRAGHMVTLSDVIKEVGTDVARFFYLHRKADAQLEFDIDLALKKTEENPVYYVQYAYVRTKSILKKAALEKFLSKITNDDAKHIETSEHFLLKKIIELKTLLHNISENYHTHLLTYYVIELANTFS